jgi:polyisoprenoid-binding protein YceI
MGRANRLESALFVLAVLAAPLSAADYAIDEPASNVHFSVPLLAVSKVTGKFMKYDVSIDVGKNPDLSQARVTAVIAMASVDTGNDTWDAKLKTPAFFDAAKYPEIRFVSRKVRKAGAEWQVDGTLSLHGVKKEISLPFAIQGNFNGPNADEHLGIHAKFSFDRREYGMAWTGNAEAKTVGHNVTVEITLLAKRAKAAPAARN